MALVIPMPVIDVFQKSLVDYREVMALDKKDLVAFLQRNGKYIKDIVIEDYDGNTIAVLDDLDIADIDGGVLRLQMNKR
jgi:hypothetical protein